MKKYMLVCKFDGEQFVKFADTDSEAYNAKMDLECGLGGSCEVYERTTDEDGFESYTFVFA